MGLFIIAGASGCGKKFVMDKLKMLLPPAKDIKKYTTITKPKNVAHIKSDLDYDKSESQILETCGDLVYKYEKAMYGIKREDIETALSDNYNTFVIIRDYTVIKRIKKLYPQAVSIYVYTGLTGDDLTNRLTKLGLVDSKTPEQRMEREKNDYVNRIKSLGDISFDAYVENNFDYTINPQVQKIIKLVPQIKYFQTFVALPFHDDNEYSAKFIREVMDTLERKLRHEINENFDIRIGDTPEEGYNATYGITERIYKLINESYIVICDLSLDNANVFYEYRKALKSGKKVITIARQGSYGERKKGDDPQKGGIDIVYTGIKDLLDGLVGAIKKIYNTEKKL